MSEAEALIKTLDKIPDNEIVGVAAILSEKVAVMLTRFELETIASESLCVKVTLGAEPQLAPQIGSAPAFPNLIGSDSIFETHQSDRS